MKITKDSKLLAAFALLGLLHISCQKPISTKNILTVQESPELSQKRAKEITAKTSVKLADGLQIKLWATDSLSPDPIAMSIDDNGRVFITRTNRQKHSEFDIRGYRHWMTPSIALQSVEDRKAFLRTTFAPEKSQSNAWLKDLNQDGSHDWKDLAVEEEEIWRLEDTDKDGMADVSTRVFHGFNEEVSDIAAGVLVRKNDMFVTAAPDVWRMYDTNKDGIYDKKESISTGYGVHIGFSGHNLSGLIEGPDGKIYWQIGDIGANITAKNGETFSHPNEGILARSNPNGSDFEIFATGIRNTHEFVFDDFGNLISSDNDGDYPGESERLVHIVEGYDSGWRSNWQYGKYTDPKNNTYNVWMSEKLFKPRFEGQAAYIIPPIVNFHNGPTGMLYNPGTALGSAWKNKFFVVEFVGGANASGIWSFGLKPKGASFDLDGDKSIMKGVLATGIRFGPEGAMYIADWVTGWDTKNYGRVWKLDVTENDLKAVRKETNVLMLLDYSQQSNPKLLELLGFQDSRIRQKAQFELAIRSKASVVFKKAFSQKINRFARIHGIWGMGQIAAKNSNFAAELVPLLADEDEEIMAQALKVLGDIKYTAAESLILPLLAHQNPRIQFFASQALGRFKSRAAIEPLLKMIERNNDKDLYLRHAGVVALSRIGAETQVAALVNHESKALRTAGVLVLRRLKSVKIADFLQDKDEYIVTEAARGINDDTSIEAALPALAETILNINFTSEALLRRSINACLRVGTEKTLDLLIGFSERNDIPDKLRSEALETIGSWANPSVLDRVDGRYRGEMKHDSALVKAKIASKIDAFLQSTNPEVLVATTKLLGQLGLENYNQNLIKLYDESQNTGVRSIALATLAKLNDGGIEKRIQRAIEDKDRVVRATALGLLNKVKVSKEALPTIVNPVFATGTISEQQQLLKVMGGMPVDNTRVVFEDLLAKMQAEKLSATVKLDLIEAIEATKSEALIAQTEVLKAKGTETDSFKETLYGGIKKEGSDTFNYNSAVQCVRCHSVGQDGGNVGPNLKRIGSLLSREQILQAMIEPSARLAPGFGTVTLTLSDGETVTGILEKEDETELVLKTTDAEPLKVAKIRIKSRENQPSSMPPMGSLISKREIRNLVEYLSSLK